MPSCAQCGGLMFRSRRRGLERFRFHAIYRCRDCDSRVGRAWFGGKLFLAYVRCPRCGNVAPDVRAKRDKIDRMRASPGNLLHRVLGGTLYHCVYCRLQFYDVRGLEAEQAQEVEQPEIST